jgi:hypothetical protein
LHDRGRAPDDAHLQGETSPSGSSLPTRALRRASRRQERQASQLDTQTAITQRVSIKVAATRHRFYAVESTESPQDNRIESLLSLVEHHAAESIARLLEAPETMDEFDQIDIAIFVALQVQRTPTSLKRTEELILQTRERCSENTFTTPPLSPGRPPNMASTCHPISSRPNA